MRQAIFIALALLILVILGGCQAHAKADAGSTTLTRDNNVTPPEKWEINISGHATPEDTRLIHGLLGGGK